MKEHPYLCAFAAEEKEMGRHTDGFETFPWNSITFVYKFHSHFWAKPGANGQVRHPSDRWGRNH